MVGLINLFVSILKYPSSPAAQSDVALLDSAAGHIGHMKFITANEQAFPFTREVAATRGLVPSDDSLEDAKVVGRAVRGGRNKESRVVQMKEMRHPWDMQAPKLFAGCVVAWVEGRELPSEMEKVEL